MRWHPEGRDNYLDAHRDSTLDLTLEVNLDLLKRGLIAKKLNEAAIG
jgi:hypothetical protein